MTNIEIGLLCTLAGVLIAWAGYRLNAKKDTKAEGQEIGTVLTELGYIKANTDEIKAEQKEQRKTNTEFYERMSAVEASAKQAHKRIDRLEGLDHHTSDS